MRAAITIGMLTILLYAAIAMLVEALELATNSLVNTLFSSAVFGVNPRNFLMETAHWKVYVVGSTATNWVTVRDDLRNAFQSEDGKEPTRPPAVQ